MRYYEVIIIITCLFMLTQLIHLIENETLTQKEKKYLIIIAVCVIIGTVCEYLGAFLNEKIIETRLFHAFVKAVEFSIVPCIPILYCFAVNFKEKNKSVNFIIYILLGINCACEFISMFVPFVYYINESNVYVHERFYWIYVMYYMCAITYFIYIFLKSIKKFQSKSILSLISIIVFFLIGYMIKRIDLQIRTDWLIVAMVFSAFLSYYSNLCLKFDVLTSLLNRRSYENQLKKINYETAIIKLDVNNFKHVNDTYGHQCGDVCLRVVSSVIIKAYGKVGWCYRTGGDEFDVILKPNKLDYITHKTLYYDTYKAIDDLNASFDELLSQQFEQYPMLKYGVSKGYGIFYGYIDSSCEGMQDKRFSAGTITDVIEIADKRMYENKKKIKTE